MGLEVTMFFTFYGLTLLKKKLDLSVSTLGNPAMAMPMFGLHIGMPNIVSAIPGVDAAATAMMKNLIKKKRVASIEEPTSLSAFLARRIGSGQFSPFASSSLSAMCFLA
jgi:peroxiredoxin family protein